ncbi:protein lingerer isoform X1 [Halyomorpha halys]|uniref:protein lingerer isoform X1 n=1 Tax=Halyomorpha halys TaxID=286706 RepID=UPI0006D51BDF|nr:protein lingerer isoform X1 [Halyomorpha halys]XP_014272856.1 protein lingerer isoform X1 [Halyomorpha halys]XP_014272857.1 protein lingerer isoform X1 [Halyomorpha halys]
MSLPSKVRKAKNTENSQATKASKADNKQESMKQSEKAQPTAEQMRIAQIIDTKTEDPYLKEKLKQVMDATQKSIDDAYTALHDCDNDPNRAVNLLLEGIESEWSTSSKKKKNRTSGEKNTKEKEQPSEAPVEEENWDHIANLKLTTNSKTGNIRGRGRGFRGGRQASETQSNDTSDRSKRTSKVLNGPIRGRGSRGRPQSRGFGRGRGTFRRPIDTWDPQRPPVSSNINHDNNSEDWDNEEYTGSLANSQIYTSSGTGNSPPSINNSLLGTNNIAADDFEKKNQLQVDINPGKTGSNLSKNPELNSLTIPFHQSYAALPEPAITSPVGVRSPTMGSNLIMISPRAERSSILISNQNKEESKISEKAITPPMGVRSPPMATNLIMMSRNDRTGINNQEIRMHRPRPKIPPPSKIPATAVEMPPDSVENNIGLLDVQFGALELNETNESVQVSPPTPHPSPSPVSSEKLLPHQSGATSDSLLLNETSFSPVRNNGAASISQISDLTAKVSDVSSSLYQEPTYQTSPYSKTAQQSPSVYSSSYSSGQMTSTSSIIYSTSSSQSTYSSSTGGVYGGISSSYPHYQYNSYPSQQTQTLPILTNSTNSYQSVLGSQQQYGSSSQSVYGTSGLPTQSYTTPYQNYNSSVQHNHKQGLVSSSSSSSKEFETSQASVNLSSISHSGSINPTPTLLSATQTTPTSKPTSISSMGKSTVVTNMPPGVPPLVGTHQYIMGQGGIPYFQQPMYYEDLQLMQQQRLAPHISTGYYEMGYPTSTTREGVQYNMNDGRFARTDNTSPVQASSISQQSGSQAHQQPMMNQPMPPAYAYFYGGSAMIPGNFQYGAPTLYPVAAGGTTSTHGNTSSGVYGKGPNNFSGNYGMYENNQGASTGSSDFKTSTSSGPKVQPTQTANPSTTSDIGANIYSTKSHSALSKSYEKQGFHCATPPPFNIGSQNSGMGPSGYPQHLFIPAITPHHNTTTLMHQPIHQDGSNTMSGRSQGNQQAKVVMTKGNYSSSTYWPQN